MEEQAMEAIEYIAPEELDVGLIERYLEELPDKLNEYGFSDEEIARYETRLKYIVREALE